MRTRCNNKSQGYGQSYMKNLLLLIAMLGLSAIAFADNYSVTVTYTVTHEYYNSKTLVCEFSVSQPNQTEIIREEGDTPDEAENKAVNTCQYVCQGRRKIGTETVNGVMYNVYEVRSVYSARATKLN